MIAEGTLDFISAVLILSAAVVPAYLSTKVQGDIRNLTIALTVFVAAHGVYHIVQLGWSDQLADGVFQPVSVLALIAFGALYLRVSYERTRQEAVKT